mgnify:CR=1 FL=1
MIRRPPRSTQSRSSAASDVYKRQAVDHVAVVPGFGEGLDGGLDLGRGEGERAGDPGLSLIHISEPTRPY